MRKEKFDIKIVCLIVRNRIFKCKTIDSTITNEKIKANKIKNKL